MEKRKKPGRKHLWTRILATLLAVVLVMSSVNLSVFAKNENQTSASDYLEETSSDTGAVLESDVNLTLYQDEDGNSFIDIEMTVNETASAEAEDISVKMILPAGLTVTDESLEVLQTDSNVTVIGSVADEAATEFETAAELEAAAVDDTYEALLCELADYTSEELASYGSAVVWEDQTVSAGGSNTYVLTAAADADVYDGSTGVYYVDGTAVDSEYIQITDAGDSSSASSEEEENTESTVSEEEDTESTSSGEEEDAESTESTVSEEDAESTETTASEDENTDVTYEEIDGENAQTLLAAVETSSSSAYDGTALKAYADSLMDTYGLKVTITQSPAGSSDVLSGDAVTWYVTVTIPTAENYSGFSSYNKTLWDSYDDLTVSLCAPEGITITSVIATGYTSTINTDDTTGRTTAVVSLGDIAASAQTISFTVTGYIDADPAPATGTTYTLTEDDITYSTNITVKDRETTPASDVATYTVTGTTSTDLSGFTLTSDTDDTWALTKTQNDISVEGNQLKVVYTIELLMNNYTSWDEYTVNGRVNFDSFSIVDTPTITYGGTTYEPVSVTAVNNTTSDTYTGTTSVEITGYADLDDTHLTETTASGVALDGDVPVYTTYTVTAYYNYASDFESDFFDVITYDVNNTAELNYSFEYAAGTQVTGTSKKTVNEDYTNWAEPATIDLHKIIQSIYGGGDYVSGTSLDDDYTGTVTFTILDENGDAAELYALIDTDGDGTEEYVKISNVITITRDSNGNASLYVTQENNTKKTGVAASVIKLLVSLFSANNNSSEEYEGLLYLNAGTYSIAETGNTMTCTSFTEFQADSGTTLSTSDNKTYSFTLTAGQDSTLYAYNTETRGSISFNKSATDYSGTSTTGSLAGAVFGLYSDADCKNAVEDSSGDEITATSDSQGIVTFTKLEPGTYYIKEISAPDGYLLDTGIYTVVVKANDTTTTFTDSSGTVYNKKNAATLTFVKYLLSTDANGDLVRVAVDQTRIDSDFTGGVFVLQYYDEDSNTWVTLTDRTITLERSRDSSNVTISSDDLEGLPVYTDSSATKAYQYRIVETLPTNYSLVELFEGTDDGDDINATPSTDVATGETLAITDAFTLESGDTTISMTNQTTGEISVRKQYIQAGTSGATTSTADDTTAVTVYLLKKSGTSYTYIGTATTGSNGDVTISGVDILGSDSKTAQEYYWAEATSNTAYSSYALEGGTTIDVDVDGDGTDEKVYLLGTVAYASAYDSEDTETTLTNILPYVRVQLFKKSTATGNFVSGAGYTIYRVTDNGNEVLCTSGTVESGGSSIVLEAGYVYHVYETTVPGNYTGLTTYDGTSSIGNYMEIDLTSAVPDERGDDGVTRGTYAADTTLYDTPYPTLTLTKNLVTVNGTTVSTSSGYSATFKVYRSETADGTYTLYKSSYTANSSVSLEPGYYYAFVENVSSSNIAPEVYPGTSGTSVSGATLTQITLSDGTTAYAYVTTEMIESGDNGAAKSYSIATVTNYENSSSVTLTKYAYDDGSVSSRLTLPGATFAIYTKDDNGDYIEVTRKVTGTDGTLTFSGLAIYDDDGNKITYYIKEIKAPDGYLLSDEIITVTLTPGEVTSVSMDDEHELTVSVPVTWEDCLQNKSYSLEGATVYAYEVSEDEYGNTVYTLVGSATSVASGDNAYATFTGLKHNTEYVFILGASGVTDDTDGNYPLYASEDGSEDYLVTTTVTTDGNGDTVVTYSDAPTTLYSLDGYQTITYSGSTDKSQTSDTVSTSLVNHLLYLQIDIQKYCSTVDHSDNRLVGLYNSNGTRQTASGTWYVNGAQFTLYRQALTADEIEALENGEDITITYDSSKLEKVDNDTSSGTGEASADNTYDTAYVYWLVETATGTAHTWASGTSYYRLLLYSDTYSGTIIVENATGAQKFTANETVYLNVENSCGSGTHEYLVSTIYLNKWGGYYDEFGVDTEDYSPLNDVTFSFVLSNGTTTVDLDTSDMTDGDTALKYGETETVTDQTTGTTETFDQSDNDAGQITQLFKFPVLLNEWVVAVANASGLNITTITDITSDSSKLADFNNITGEVWTTYSAMLYVAGVIDASDRAELTDLAANDGEVVKLILYAYAQTYSGTTIAVNTENGDAAYISAMENVLGSFYTYTDSNNDTQSLGYKSYYAHIIIQETATTTSAVYGDYEKNTKAYELYLQFRPTDDQGSANIKYFYLDNGDRTDYYYDADPSDVSTKVLDESFDNTVREQIVNMPKLKQSVTITKYGYTLNSDTTGLTDDELDTYFKGTSLSSERMKITAEFYLQRYDSTSGAWKYYDPTNLAYVDDSAKSSALIEATDGEWSGTLSIGWYRLIEVSVKEGYDVILDGTDVNVAGTADTTEAVRYFWVKNVDGSNTVNVYDPDSVDILVHKYSLSGTEIKSGVTITLTDADGNEYSTGTWDSTQGAWVISNVSAGTYTVTESVTNSSVTDDYFQQFTITVGYGREAEAETVTLTNSSSVSSVTQYATYITGVSTSISGQVDCSDDNKEDSFTSNTISSTGATATLKVFNPGTGSLTVTKKDASTSSTVTSTAEFKVYYHIFDVDSSDAYVAKAEDSDAPSFDASSSDWTLVGEYSTSGGSFTLSNLTPGWYAIVESSAPSGYEMDAEDKIVAVVADMNTTHTLTDGGNVSINMTDTKMTGLSIVKQFNLADFYNSLSDEAQYYSVTFGLYVYDTTSQTYISAYDLGLTSTTDGQVTVTVEDTTSNGKYATTGTGTWSDLVQMEAHLDADNLYTITVNGTTYRLDGSYYIKEESVADSSGDISDDWWISNVEMSSGSSLSVDSAAVTDSSGNSYYKVSGFTGNADGTVTVTNDLTYATVTILKTDDASPANPLSGAEFTVYSDAACKNAVASGTTGSNGRCTITVPVKYTTAQTYYIKETLAPDGYTIYEDTIEVSLKSGQAVSYTDSGSGLTIQDSNGVYVLLTKYDNIHDYSGTLSGLSGVTFTLLRSTDNGDNWSVQGTYTTDSSGLINFDTLKNSPGTLYMLVETVWDTDSYDGQESMWYTITTVTETTDPSSGQTTTTTSTTTAAEITETTIYTTSGDPYTGYQFSLQNIDSGSTYQLYAYNQPKTTVTFKKTGDGSGSGTPTATLEIYSIDGSIYSAGDELTSTQVTAAKNAGTLVDTITTTAVSGEDYSEATYNLSAGTYLVVETNSSGGGYVIDKDDSNEVWYLIIEVPDDGTKSMTADSFVNVTQSYGVSLTKTGTQSLSSDILASKADLEYSLAVSVTNSGPINGLTVTDSGLTVTKVWNGVGSGATTQTVSDADATKYLNGDYGITSVKIPTDASYDYSSLVFTSGDKNNFTQNITAKVTFTYADGTTEEQTAVLANVSSTDGYWTVTPSNSNLKAVSFTVTWYDETLKLYTGYELGSDFTVSDAGNTISVSMHIDQQNGGTDSYYAVAEIQNSAAVDYTYTSWDTTGTATEDVPATASDTALTEVPNVSAAQVTVNKSVENETTGASYAVIGNTLLYTITLTNSSSSLAMDNPVILDLLPQGVVAASADDENSFLANVKITSSTLGTASTLAITNVWRVRSDGYTLLEIVTSGSLAAGETVTITLEAEVDSTILNYISSNASMTNNVWVTSSTSGTVYHDNTAGSVFMGSTGSWAGDYDSTTTVGSVLAKLLGADYLDFTGYGYVSDSAAITFQATSSVNITKEVQGDQDEEEDPDNWYYGDEGGTVTVNTSDDTDDDGYANFRLTVTNMNDGQKLANIVLMDIIPKEGGASFNSNITKAWSLVYDSITSVKIDGTDVDSSHYTVWYYTGSLTTDSDVTAMQTAFDNRTASGSGWVEAADYTGEMSAITAFAVVFDSSIELDYQQKLQLIYKATVPQMSETEASNKAHLATYNDFRLIYQMDTSGSISVDTYSLDSNYVYALLETEPVGVGGMFWIDADGDGVQDEEDVTPDTYDASTDSGSKETTATTYNSRTNDYSSYAVVTTLLNSASVRLLTYNGSTNSVVTNYSSLSGNSWRFLFTDLTSANISSSYTDSTAYDSSGILWKALAGANSASWYRLEATIAGNSSIKFSLTNATTDVKSYDPAEVYSSTATTAEEASLTDSNFRTKDSEGTLITTTTTSGTTASSYINTDSKTAVSENLFLYGAAGNNAQWNLAEDIGLVIYRDLQITKKDSNGSSPASGSTFAVYGPYAEGKASLVTSLDNAHLVATYTTTDADPTTVLFEDLLYFQEYIIVEVDADDSYELAYATASGTNISTISGGLTLNGDSYPAWILNIPTSSSSTDPAANNTLTTDTMTVTNAKKMTIEFIKIDGEGISAGSDENAFQTAAKLSNAVFALYASSDVTVTTDSSGNVTVTVNAGATPLYTATSDSYGVVKFAEEITDSYGNVTGYNYEILESGTYFVFETAAPSGYSLLTQNYWEVTVDTEKQKITWSSSTSGTSGTYYAVTDSSGNVTYYIPNYTEYALPSADGYVDPKLWATLLGCLLMLAAAGLWMFRKRSHAR